MEAMALRRYPSLQLPSAGGGFFLLKSDARFSGVPLSLLSSLKRRAVPLLAVCSLDKSNQGTGKVDRGSSLLNLFHGLPLTGSLTNFVATNFLPIALVSGVALGLANPAPGCIAHRYSLTKFATFGIFFIAGLKLQGKELGSAIEAWPVSLFGLASILLISPLFASIILQFQLVPQEFVKGLALFCCMPTTLSSGVALTNLVGGNAALALVLTVASNLLGTIAVPFWISNYFADGCRGGMCIPTGKLFWSLVFTLLVPLVLGKVLRSSIQGLAEYVDQNRKKLSVASTILLSLTPWMQVSTSRSLLLMVKPKIFLKALGMGIMVHLSLLGFHVIALNMLSTASGGGGGSAFLERQNSRALILVCSQKALLIVVAVVEQLNGALGQSGLLVLPCVAAHINQVIIDSVLVNFWIQKDRSESIQPHAPLLTSSS